MARRRPYVPRPSGIAGSPAARSPIGRTDIDYESMISAQFDGARRARLTLLVALAVLTVLGVLAAITGRIVAREMAIYFGGAIAVALAANEAIFRWLRRRVPLEDR